MEGCAFAFFIIGFTVGCLAFMPPWLRERELRQELEEMLKTSIGEIAEGRKRR
jgi:hypothetical protein